MTFPQILHAYFLLTRRKLKMSRFVPFRRKSIIDKLRKIKDAKQKKNGCMEENSLLCKQKVK